MSMTDPIADMLTRIRNGIMSRKARIELPDSRLKQHIAEILKNEGFINSYRRIEGVGPHKTIEIELKWAPDNRNAIAGLKRVSKPGQRKYVGKTEIPKVLGGQGIAILTTSRGVMSDRQARKLSVGGEIICEIW